MGRGGGVCTAQLCRAWPLRQCPAACRYPQKNSAGPYCHAYPQRSLRTAGAASQLLETARLAGGRQSGLGAGRCRGLLSNAFHRHGGGRLFHARCPGSPRASRTRCAHHATRCAPAASHHAGPACGVRTRSTAVASSDRQRHSGPIARLGNNAHPGACGSFRTGSCSCSCSRCSTTTRRLHPSCRSAPGAGRRQGRAPPQRPSPPQAKARASTPDAPAAPPDTTASASTAQPLPAVGTAPGYYINVGLFAEEANARKAQARLLNEGLPAFRQETRVGKKRRLRVRVGPYSDRADADAAAITIRAMGLDALVARQGA